MTRRLGKPQICGVIFSVSNSNVESSTSDEARHTLIGARPNAVDMYTKYGSNSQTSMHMIKELNRHCGKGPN